MHGVLCRPQKIIPPKLQERSSFSHDSARPWNNRVAFERSGQDGSRSSPQVCSTMCQRHSDEAPRPPWPTSGLKSRIREYLEKELQVTPDAAPFSGESHWWTPESPPAVLGGSVATAAVRPLAAARALLGAPAWMNLSDLPKTWMHHVSNE